MPSAFVKLISVLSIIFLNIACTKSSKQSKEVNLAIWGQYLSQDQIDAFTKSTGIKLNVSNYSSNEELLAKVQSGASGIDVAVPSDYMVEILIKSNLLESLNQNEIPNSKGLWADVMKQSYDPSNAYSLPYAWSTAGIAVNTDLYKGKLSSWKEFFNDKALSGKISMLDDVRESTAAALKMNGYSVNTVKPEELAKAKATLLAVKPRLKMFRSDTIEALLNKEVAVAHAYSTDALQAAEQSKGKIKYFIPEEGGTRAIDNLVILKGAKNIAGAHKLIDYLLSPEMNLDLVNKIKAGPVVKATFDKVSPEVKANKALFPPPEMMNKLEKIIDLGDKTTLYDDLWTEVKTK